jgi:hypothetical protein
VISAATLEHWSYEKRALTTTFVRWLSLSMALLAFFDIFNDTLLALLLTQQESFRHLLHIAIASLIAPSIFHALSLWRLMLQESRYTPNYAFRQWLQDHSGWLPLLSFLGAIRPDILRNLLTSNAFGWSLFECPLSRRRYTLEHDLSL